MLNEKEKFIPFVLDVAENFGFSIRLAAKLQAKVLSIVPNQVSLNWYAEHWLRLLLSDDKLSLQEVLHNIHTTYIHITLVQLTFTHAHTHAFTHPHKYKHTFINLLIHTHTHSYTHTHTHTCIHTHTQHTPTPNYLK